MARTNRPHLGNTEFYSKRAFIGNILRSSSMFMVVADYGRRRPRARFHIPALSQILLWSNLRKISDTRTCSSTLNDPCPCRAAHWRGYAPELHHERAPIWSFLLTRGRYCRLSIDLQLSPVPILFSVFSVFLYFSIHDAPNLSQIDIPLCRPGCEAARFPE